MRRPRGGARPRPARAGTRRGFPRDLGRRLHRHRPVRAPAGRRQGQRQAPDPALGRHRRARYLEQRGGGRARQRHRHGAQGSLGLERHGGRDAGRSRCAQGAAHRVRRPGARGRAALSAERQHLRRRRDRRHRPRPDARGDRGRSHHHHAHRRAGSQGRLRPLHLPGRRRGQRGEPQDRQAGGHGDGEVGAPARVGRRRTGRRGLKKIRAGNGGRQWKSSTM